MPQYLIETNPMPRAVATLASMQPVPAALVSHTANPWAVGESRDPLEFAALQSELLASGGLESGEDVGRLRELQGQGNFIDLARLLASGDLMGVAWSATIWIPMFQFEQPALVPKPGMRWVLAELGMERDDWACAAWFAQPNQWLKNRRPADLLASDLTEVLAAARIDRWIRRG